MGRGFGSSGTVCHLLVRANRGPGNLGLRGWYGWGFDWEEGRDGSLGLCGSGGREGDRGLGRAGDGGGLGSREEVLIPRSHGRFLDGDWLGSWSLPLFAAATVHKVVPVVLVYRDLLLFADRAEGGKEEDAVRPRGKCSGDRVGNELPCRIDVRLFVPEFHGDGTFGGIYRVDWTPATPRDNPSPSFERKGVGLGQEV